MDQLQDAEDKNCEVFLVSITSNIKKHLRLRAEQQIFAFSFTELQLVVVADVGERFFDDNLCQSG